MLGAELRDGVGSGVVGLLGVAIVGVCVCSFFAVICIALLCVCAWTLGNGW